MDVAYSINSVPVRLTDERWSHIVKSHDDMAAYFDDCLWVVERPDLVLSGNRGTLIAVRGYGKQGYLNVVYREVSSEDGFVITAYFSHKISRRKVVWQR